MIKSIRNEKAQARPLPRRPKRERKNEMDKFDVKEKIEEIVGKVKGDAGLMDRFKADPVIVLLSGAVLGLFLY